jgi:hypothetical protein
MTKAIGTGGGLGFELQTRFAELRGNRFEARGDHVLKRFKMIPCLLHRWPGSVLVIAMGEPEQPSSQHPLLWWGVNSTLFGEGHPWENSSEVGAVNTQVPMAMCSGSH